ncbi:hypothetical protein V1291_001370 [Nitrobacteraceae bacterium AZCC 1564]
MSGVLRFIQALLAVSLLSGCTFFFDVQESVEADPAPDSKQQRTIFGEIHKITASMKGGSASEISEVGPNEAQSGPEKWTVCSRASFSNEMRYFTFFVKGEKVANWRPSVINDRCEARRFSSF